MGGVLQSTATLMDNQNRRDQISALNAYLKKQLTQMPVSSTVVSYQRGDGEGLVQNGVIMGTVNFATAIDATQQANGYYTLRMTTCSTASESQQQDSRQVLQQSVTTNDPSLVWTSLMKDVKTIDWKFLDFNQTVWVEVWSSGTKPNLMEFDIQPAGDLLSTTMDFWLPKIDPIQTAVSGVTGTSTGGTTPRTQRVTPAATPNP